MWADAAGSKTGAMETAAAASKAAPTQAHFYLSSFLFGSFFPRYLVSILSTHKNVPRHLIKC